MKKVTFARSRLSRGFTLVELLVAIAVLTIILFFLGSAVAFVSQAWSAGVGTTDNYQKARTILSAIDRDVQMMVLRPDVAAFRDNSSPATPSSCKPVFAFYTNAEGAPGGDNRTASFVQYGLDTGGTPTLLRYSNGLNFTNGTISLPPPPVAPATTSVVPGLPSMTLTPTLAQTDTVSNGVIAFQWQFVDGAGYVLNPSYTPQPPPNPVTTTPFTYDFNTPGTPSNPRAVIVTMVVLSNSATQMAQTMNLIGTLQGYFDTSPLASTEIHQTYGYYWNSILTAKMAAHAGIPQPVMLGLRVFERRIPLPGTTPSSS